MKPPLMLLVWGVAESWAARIIKVGTQAGGWHKPDPEDRREITGPTPRDAVLRTITRYGKAPRTCRRCGKTWECKRTRRQTLCPQCQSAPAAKEEV